MHLRLLGRRPWAGTASHFTNPGSTQYGMIGQQAPRLDHRYGLASRPGSLLRPTVQSRAEPVRPRRCQSWQKNWSLKSGSHALSRPSISRLIAEVDGKSTPIFRADILFRVGTHRVTFRFAPFSLANLRVALLHKCRIKYGWHPRSSLILA